MCSLPDYSPISYSSFLEDVVRACLWPTSIWRCVALQGVTSRDKLCPCVPCTATWLRHQEHGTTKSVRKLKHRKELQCHFNNTIFTCFHYNVAKRKQTPAEILASLGEQSIDYKERKLPGVTVSKAMTSTRVKFCLRVIVQCSDCGLYKTWAFANPAKRLFFLRSREGCTEKLRNHQSQLLVSLPASGHNYSELFRANDLTNFFFTSWKIHE